MAFKIGSEIEALEIRISVKNQERRFGI